MLKFLKALVQPATRVPGAAAEAESPPPEQIDAPGVPPLAVRDVRVDAAGMVLFDWAVVGRWVEGVPDESARAAAWAACERAWLEHLRVTLGAGYCVRSQGTALLLSALPDRTARTMLDFVNKTVQRIVRVLDGLAEQPRWGHDILIVFDDAEAYYRYVSHYYTEPGEFAASSGMYIDAGCGHFVTVAADLHAVEPVIAHELTHACLAHLPIPAWLNEGLAVNTEARLCPRPRGPADPRQMHARHLKFWGPAEVQQFWSGKSFLRNDEGNELSYDLARLLVSQFAADWERFRAFALAADLDGGAQAAAREHLDVDLGLAVCAVLEQEPSPEWAPRPGLWQGVPEKGAFRAGCLSDWHKR